MNCKTCGVPLKSPPARMALPRFTGLCTACRRAGFKGEGNPNWRGGKRSVGEQGEYIGIYTPDHPCVSKYGYVLEHRLVMESKLGRLLNPEEVVHHINGNRKDNRIENLEVIMNQSVHAKKHQLGGLGGGCHA